MWTALQTRPHAEGCMCVCTFVVMSMSEERVNGYLKMDGGLVGDCVRIFSPALGCIKHSTLLDTV